MLFRTPVPIVKWNDTIDYNSKIVSLGSCFAVNMAEKLDYFKFQNLCNPFGILFHPLAIDKLLSCAFSSKQFTDDDLFFHNERWHCYDVHSDFSSGDSAELIANLNAIVKLTKQQIIESTHFIITYGTSWVYRHKVTEAIVANCHKVPQKQFTKELLSIEIIKGSIISTLALIKSLNPKAKIIFTVSPVRHIKDGFVENQVSKSNLITALYSVLQDSKFREKGVYFPSFEIMMDELRDYRFYAEDMLHPNQVAIDYIWNRFKETAISETAFATMEEVENVQKSLSHRPFNVQSEAHLKFLSNLNQKITKLESQYSHMKF